MKKVLVLLARILIIVLLLAIVAALALYRGRTLVARTYSVPGHSSEKVRIVGLSDLHGNQVPVMK